ncbi:MAG: sigma-70 family RNA polymerase sigma factor [Patescibacteria group bacterium]
MSILDKVINRAPLLTKEREWELGRLVAEQKSQEARHELLEANIRLVIYIARWYKRVNPQAEVEDLVSMGLLGLNRAIDKYDYRRKLRFATYATWWIRRTIVRDYYETERAIRLPIYVVEQTSRLRRAVPLLEQKLGRVATVDDICTHLGYDPNKLTKLLEYCQDVISLDMPVGENNSVLGDLQADPACDPPTQSPFEELIEELLDCLPKREREVIQLRYGFLGMEKMTLVEVAEHLEISRERVRQLEMNAVKRLRNFHRDNQS